VVTPQLPRRGRPKKPVPLIPAPDTGPLAPDPHAPEPQQAFFDWDKGRVPFLDASRQTQKARLVGILAALNQINKDMHFTGDFDGGFRFVGMSHSRGEEMELRIGLEEDGETMKMGTWVQRKTETQGTATTEQTLLLATLLKDKSKCVGV
jgi:hypothetical protein